MNSIKFESIAFQPAARIRTPQIPNTAATARIAHPLLNPTIAPSSEMRRYRCLWISDIHLGTKSCKANFLRDFLRHHDSDRLYLLGDFLDGWKLKRRWYWTPEHHGIVHQILGMARQGTQVVYIPGNHDEALRDFAGLQFGNIRIETEFIHEMRDGRRFLVFHGDQFDKIIQFPKWLSELGRIFYSAISRLNDLIHRFRSRAKLPYWSFSGTIKKRVQNAVAYVDRYEQAVAMEAKRRGLDGVICGHIHHANSRKIDGVTYINDGDWVENCTALAETFEGQLELIRWAKTTPEVVGQAETHRCPSGSTVAV